MNISGVGGGGGGPPKFTNFAPVFFLNARGRAGMNPCARNLHHISSFLHSKRFKFSSKTFFPFGPVGTAGTPWPVTDIGSVCATRDLRLEF